MTEVMREELNKKILCEMCSKPKETRDEWRLYAQKQQKFIDLLDDKNKELTKRNEEQTKRIKELEY